MTLTVPLQVSLTEEDLERIILVRCKAANVKSIEDALLWALREVEPVPVNKSAFDVLDKFSKALGVEPAPKEMIEAIFSEITQASSAIEKIGLAEDSIGFGMDKGDRERGPGGLGGGGIAGAGF
jgi:hypothetical protein